MRLLVHDFAGHPFQAQLSRKISALGHEVVHSYCSQYVSGKGDLTRRNEDAAGLQFIPVSVSRPLVKYGFVNRVLFERAYANALCAHVREVRPDSTILANVPLLVVGQVSSMLRKSGIRSVLWHQDITSLAIGDELRRRLPGPIAGPLARRLIERERRVVANASAVIAIGPAFVDVYRSWGLDREVFVIPNWAPIDEIRPVARDNHWSASQQLATGQVRLLYSGTLGRKHNPGLLVELLAHTRRLSVDATMVVVSEGDGADDLKSAARGDGLLRVLPFQPVEQLSEVLGAADILVAILEPSAGRFSIPSKVLSYLAAGRPVLGLVPSDNPAAEDIVRAGGFVAPPTTDGVAFAARWIRDTVHDQSRMLDLGRRARALAESQFAIGPIAAQFISVMEKTAQNVGGATQKMSTYARTS